MAQQKTRSNKVFGRGDPQDKTLIITAQRDGDGIATATASLGPYGLPGASAHWLIIAGESPSSVLVWLSPSKRLTAPSFVCYSCLYWYNGVFIRSDGNRSSGIAASPNCQEVDSQKISVRTIVEKFEGVNNIIDERDISVITFSCTIYKIVIIDVLNKLSNN